ncbi:hypothetical protein [Flavobacterium sp. RS13.1]|jgi:hypothetical protein|uniref:hypothetical protein n=1 Tax=Flavobacterium sp. RS13.1 TaxID=3400345 RepID=UPI003AAB869E
MNKIIIISLVLIFFSCKYEEKNIVLSNQNWIEYDSKDSIPKQFFQVLKAINGDEKIADKDEAYEATDNISDESIPTRQLKLLSKKNDQWRLVYEQGGIGTYNVYIECRIEKDSLFALKIAKTLLPIENNDSITKFLKEKRIELKDIKVSNDN